MKDLKLSLSADMIAIENPRESKNWLKLELIN